MKLFLSKSERVEHLGFDDHCVAFVGVPLLAGVAFLLFSGGQKEVPVEGALACYLLGLVHTLVYWMVNRFWIIVLRRHFPDQRDIWKRSVCIVLFAIGSVFCLKVVSDYAVTSSIPWIHEMGWGSESTIFGFVVALTLCLLVLAMYESAYFFVKYRQSTVERERLAKENMRSQLSVLKQQMNPHFLFNSLNTLVNIIPEDSHKSTLFTQRLAAVYRRILEWRHKELIALAEEVQAVQDYVFLMQTRFEDKLSVCWRWRGGAGPQVLCEGEERREVRLPVGLGASRVVPLSVQLLVENAIKHNVVSSEHPLRIDITIAPDRITVTNPLRLRGGRQLNSTGWGHQNLRARYAMTTDREVTIRQTETIYEVSIPLFAAQGRARAATA